MKNYEYYSIIGEHVKITTDDEDTVKGLLASVCEDEDGDEELGDLLLVENDSGVIGVPICGIVKIEKI